MARSAPSESGGVCALTVWGTLSPVDLEATSPDGLASWRYQLHLTPGAEQTLSWELTPAHHIAGKLLALDGKTALASVVMELIQPEGSDARSSRGEEAPTSIPQPAIRRSNLSRNLSRMEESAEPNRVLRLDGQGSYVELPAHLFDDLEEATVECWVNWQSFGRLSHFFEFGDEKHGLVVCNARTTGDLALIVRHVDGQNQEIDAGSPIIAGQWYYMAAVAGPAGMKLYVDGLLVFEGSFPGSFSGVAGGKANRLGSCTIAAPGKVADFHGQMDEVRVWKEGRTAEQIRESMFKKLTGNELDLVGL